MIFAPMHEDAPRTYMTPAWQQHEDLIAHLCQFSQNVLLITAPQNGGKTTFLQHFLDRITPALRKKAILSQPQTTSEDLMKKIFQAFELGSDDLGEAKSYLHMAMEDDYIRNQKTWTLFIDDAHLLSNEQLQTLLQLVNFDAAPHQQFQLVLLGEPSLELRLFSPEFTSIAHGKIYTIELESWTFQDVQAFLANEGISSQVNKDQIAAIFERSRGLPGYVIREKNATLGHLNTTGKKMIKRNFKLWSFHPISLGVLAGLVMGGAI